MIRQGKRVMVNINEMFSRDTRASLGLEHDFKELYDTISSVNLPANHPDTLKLLRMIDNIKGDIGVLESGKKFQVNLVDYIHIIDKNFDDVSLDVVDFSSIGDFVIDFYNDITKKYMYQSIMFRKLTYKITMRDTEYEAYSIQYLAGDMDGMSSCISDIRFIFIPELYPRLFVYPDDNAFGIPCKDCENKMCKSYKFKNCSEDAIKPDGSIDVCIVGESRKSKCGVATVMYNIALNPDCMLRLIAYIIYSVNNPHLIVRDEEVTPKRNTSIHKAKTTKHSSEDRVVNINKYIYNSHTTVKSSSKSHGGHHSSPCEHERKAFTRVYRNPDGTVRKIVNVKSTIVNRGHKSEHSTVCKIE